MGCIWLFFQEQQVVAGDRDHSSNTLEMPKSMGSIYVKTGFRARADYGVFTGMVWGVGGDGNFLSCGAGFRAKELIVTVNVMH